METDKRLCKLCDTLKARTLVGKFPDGKNKKFSDESGKLWNGSVCGTCNVKRSHENMKRLRQRQRSIPSEE